MLMWFALTNAIATPIPRATLAGKLGPTRYATSCLCRGNGSDPLGHRQVTSPLASRQIVLKPKLVLEP